jgi:hypothetical protein
MVPDQGLLSLKYAQPVSASCPRAPQNCKLPKWSSWDHTWGSTGGFYRNSRIKAGLNVQSPPYGPKSPNFFLFFFWRYYGLNAGPHVCYRVFYHLSHIPTFCFLVYFQIRSLISLEQQFSYLHLLSIWVYRHETPHLGPLNSFFTEGMRPRPPI